MIKKGQSMLEFGLIFVIAAALIMGLLFLWGWSKDNLPARQDAFEDTRLNAGTKGSAGDPEISYNATSPKEPRYL